LSCARSIDEPHRPHPPRRNAPRDRAGSTATRFSPKSCSKSAVERNSARSDERVRRDLPLTVRARCSESLRRSTKRSAASAASSGDRTYFALICWRRRSNRGVGLAPPRSVARVTFSSSKSSRRDFSFSPGLTREAIYGEFLAERQPLHRSIALALEDAPVDERSLEALALSLGGGRCRRERRSLNQLAATRRTRPRHEDAIAFYSARARSGDSVRPFGARSWKDRRSARGAELHRGSEQDLHCGGGYLSRCRGLRARGDLSRARGDHRLYAQALRADRRRSRRC